MKYPLKVRLYLANYEKIEPDSKCETYEVRARYTENNGFVAMDPNNQKEITAYESIENGVNLHDTNHFYWVGEVIQGTDPRT
jgi:hypothetical protein